MKLSSMSIWDLREERDRLDNESEKLIAIGQSTIDLAQSEDRDFTDSEQDQFETNMTAIESLKSERREVERAIDFKAGLQNHLNQLGGGDPARLANNAFVSGRESFNNQGTKNMNTNVNHRIAPLKSFQGPDAIQNAITSGKFVQAITSRFRGGHDEASENYVRNALGYDVFNVGTEGSPTGGGYTVPTPMSDAIINVRALAGVSRQLARVVPMTSETLDIPRKEAGTSVYYPGEGGTITASDQTWGNVHLTAKKRAIMSKVTQELRDDAIIGIVDDLVTEMGTDFAVKEDSEFVNGDSTSSFGGETGLLASLGAGGVYTPATSGGFEVWSGLTTNEFVNCMAKLPDRYWPFGTAWLCSSVFYYSTMLKIQAAAGGNRISELEAGPGRPRFLGSDVFFSNQMPTSTGSSQVSALFGAFSKGVVIGERAGIAFAQSEHLNFAEDLLAIRATTRYDINCHDMGDSSNPGAVVALATAAS